MGLHLAEGRGHETTRGNGSPWGHHKKKSDTFMSRFGPNCLRMAFVSTEKRDVFDLISCNTFKSLSLIFNTENLKEKKNLNSHVVCFCKSHSHTECRQVQLRGDTLHSSRLAECSRLARRSSNGPLKLINGRKHYNHLVTRTNRAVAALFPLLFFFEDDDQH